MISRQINPVSYTHLDVYKRQGVMGGEQATSVLKAINQKKNSPKTPDLVEMFEAVSYTHLGFLFGLMLQTNFLPDYQISTLVNQVILSGFCNFLKSFGN